jgi:hypothetical protein
MRVQVKVTGAISSRWSVTRRWDHICPFKRKCTGHNQDESRATGTREDGSSGARGGAEAQGWLTNDGDISIRASFGNSKAAIPTPNIASELFLLTTLNGSGDGVKWFAGVVTRPPYGNVTT